MTDYSDIGSYIETALWISNDESDESGGEPMDRNYDPGYIAPDTLETMRREWRAFREAAGELIDECGEERAQHDFWLTRNGHGAGFWDGDWSEVAGTILDNAAKAYPEIDLYVGDDGKIHA